MCGIAGLINFDDGADLLQSMIRRIRNRGPDGCGIYQGARRSGGSVLFGHRRLAIIDPRPESNQPFVKQGLVITYNGEIYNYREIQADLIRRGVRFETNCDTEVILEAWRCWGPASLDRLRGMFAFAIFDERSGEIVLARDQFGIKPLYFSTHDNRLAFASEQKALLLAVDSVQPNYLGIVASMMYYWVPDDIPTVTGIEKLPPGHYMKVLPDGSVQKIRYWDMHDQVSSGEPISNDELFHVIEDSVRQHLVADVPVSALLSGGLDSSLVTLLAKQYNPDIEAYTIGFREEDQRLESMPDDLHYARRLCRQHDIKLHEIVIEPDVVHMLDEVVDALDEPIGDPAAINTIMICRAARSAGTKVLLSGMGADEMFGGYRKHYACLLANRYRQLPSLLRSGVIEPLSDLVPVSIAGRGLRLPRWGKRFLKFAAMEEEGAFRRSYTLYDDDELRALLPAERQPLVGSLAEHHRRIYESWPADSQVNRMCLTDVQLFMVGLNLTYTDRASMHASTEVRVPFIDTEVFKAAFRLSGERKIRGRERKSALKEAAERVLPREFVYRSKAAFSAPLRAWIRRDLAELIDDRLLNGSLVASGFLNRAVLEGIVRKDRNGLEDRSKEIWQLLTLEVWMSNLRAA